MYQDTVTCYKLIFPSAIMRILHHFSIHIPNSPCFTIMDAISAGSVRWSEAQLQSKQLHVETIDPAASTIPSFSAPSTSTAGGVTLKAIMVQRQCMDTCLDSLTNEMCQVNTHVSHIAHRQAHLGGFAPSPSPSSEVSANEDDDAGDDEDNDASSSNDDEMTISQWLTLFHLW